MRTRSQNGKRSRSKGHAWEREVAAMLAPLFPDRDVRRNVAQARTARREGCDVEGTDWWIECKVGASIDLRGALAQAEDDAELDSRYELVIAKLDRRRPVVVCRLAALVSRETASWAHEGSVAVLDLEEWLDAEKRARAATLTLTRGERT